MKKFRGATFIIIIPISFALLLFSCKKDEVVPSPQVLEINNFIWNNMNELYLWDDLIPQNIDRTREFDPEGYFKKLLNKPTDRWSFITDDYEGLINSFKGIEKSFGHHFKLYQLPGSSNIIGVIKYVVPNSPASQKGMLRGDIFYKVNGRTLNTSNYYELLYENENYTLSFGEFNFNGELVFKEEKSLSAVVIAENPIHISKTIDYEGDKIGYLSYNHFIMDYNDSLVNVFNTFKSEGIQNLVLDLRYNPGGSIGAAILLSSMIAPASVVDNNEILSKLVWNEGVTDYYLESEGEESDNLIYRFITPEVNLNLDKVYILITRNSASASELVINCLSPYMEVILIGSENTTGKYVGSITIDDDEADHGWAMQPIVLKTANAIGISDYANGFAPDYLIEDDFSSPLGTLTEDMLVQAMELITGKTISAPARTTEKRPLDELKSIVNRKETSRQNMYLDKIY